MMSFGDTTPNNGAAVLGVDDTNDDDDDDMVEMIDFRNMNNRNIAPPPPPHHHRHDHTSLLDSSNGIEEDEPPSSSYSRRLVVFFQRVVTIVFLYCCPVIAVLSFLLLNTGRRRRRPAIVLVTFYSALVSMIPITNRWSSLLTQLKRHITSNNNNMIMTSLLSLLIHHHHVFLIFIFAIFTLKQGLFTLTKLFLVGNILSHLLFCIGLSFFMNGITFLHRIYYSSKEHTDKISFNQHIIHMKMILLFIACSSILLISILSVTQSNHNNEHDQPHHPVMKEYPISRAIALVLFGVYMIYGYFRLVTHKHLFDDNDGDDGYDGDDDGMLTNYHSSDDIQYEVVDTNEKEDVDENDDDEHIEFMEPQMNKKKKRSTLLPLISRPADVSLTFIICGILVITVVMFLLLQCIVSSIEEATNHSFVSGVFMSAIVIPIMFTTGTHCTSIQYALQGNINRSLRIAVESTLQIALGIIPLLIMIGWMIGKELTLNFGRYESCTLLMAVLAMTISIKDGQANYLIGLILISCYAIISFGFFVCVDRSLS